MAVRTASFEIAALDAEEAEAKVDTAERLVELQHGGGRFSLWRQVGQGAFGRFTLRMSKATPASVIPNLDTLLRKTMLDAAEVEKLAEAGAVDADGIPYAERLEDGEIPVGPDYLWDAFEAGAFKDEDGDDTPTPIYQMIGAVMKEFTGFPTEPSPASTSGRPASGRRSTATSRRVGSTRSSSRPAASQD